MNDELCATCGIGYYLPSGVCDHCNCIRKPTIEDLERILASGENPDIEIQPDGSIRAVPKGTAVNADVKPITFRYAKAEYY